MAAHLACGTPLPERFTLALAQTAGSPAPLPGPMTLGFLAGFEFGQMTAETMSVLAESGPLRITPWRMILVEGAKKAPDLPGLITRADDPMLKVIACTGAPGCPQALIATRPLARALSSSLPKGTLLHIAGCAKGCAHPGPAALTLVGCPGGTLGLIRSGTAASHPDCTDLSPQALIRSPAILTERANAP